MAPTGILFYDGRAKPLSVSGQFQAGAYYQFYLTGTTTFTNVYADGALGTPLDQTPHTGQTTAAGDGRLAPIYMDPKVIYRYQLFNAANQLLEDIDPYVVPASAASATSQTFISGGVDSGAVNTYVLTIANYPAYFNGSTIVFTTANTNTGSSTLNVNSLGAVLIKLPNGSVLPAGEIIANVPTTVTYLNGVFYLQSPPFQSNAGSNQTITGNQENFNLFQQMGSPSGAQTVNLTIAGGVRLIATDPTSFALDTSGFASGSTINLTNNGFILGRGGDGGAGASLGGAGGTTTSRQNAIAGRNAGTAIQGPGAGVSLNITNANGFIWGGGGGGGGGGGTVSGVNQSSNGGGGGGGAGGSKGGPGGTDSSQSDTNGSFGGDGTWVTSGAGGAGGAGITVGGTARSGGAGGDWGVAGTVGAGVATDGGNNTSFGAAGTAGKAQNDNGGTVTWVSGSGSPNAKGAIH
jgi:hypothetical protein